VYTESYTSVACNLPILAGIQPTELRRSHTVSSMPCHGVWTPAPFYAHPSIKCRCMTPSAYWLSHMKQ